MLAVVALLLLWGLFFSPDLATQSEKASSKPAKISLRERLRLPSTTERGLPSLSGLVVIALLFVNVIGAAAILVHHSTPAEVHQTAPAVR